MGFAIEEDRSALLKPHACAASRVVCNERVARTGRGAWRDALPVAAGLLALLAWDASGLDLPLARLYGNAAGFAWRDHWLTSGLMHADATVIGWIVFGWLTLSLWRPVPFAPALTRRERIWWVATTLACVALVPLLRRASGTSCPWSLAEFGGVAHYVPHWALATHDGGPGGCFPSAHAATAFSFVAGWFVLRERAPRAARAWLVATLVAGLALGWVQMMRGAHFASHTLWTAWICWTFAAVSFHGLRRWREAHAPPRAAPMADQRA